MYPLKATLFLLSFFFLSLEGVQARVLERFEHKDQFLELSYDAEEKKVLVEGKNGRLFSRTKTASFDVSTDEQVDNSLVQLASFIKTKKFDDSFYPFAAKVLEEFRILNDNECRALFVSLSGPLASQGIDGLIEQLDQVGRFLEAPEEATKSFDIEELQLGDQNVSLRLYVDNEGQALSIGLISRNGNFMGHRFQGSIKDGYSLFDPQGKWLLSLDVKNGEQIQVKTVRAVESAEEVDLVVNTDSSLIGLSLQAGEWMIDKGLLGVDQETYLDEWIALKRSFQTSELNPETLEQLEQNYYSCRVYEDQRRAQRSTRAFCEEYLELELEVIKQSKVLEQRGQKSASFKENVKGCLADKGLVTSFSGHYALSSKSPESFSSDLQSCLQEQVLSYEQDYHVIKLTQSRLGQRFLSSEQTRKAFSEEIYLKGFKYCEDKKITIDSQDCQQHLGKISDSLFISYALSQGLSEPGEKEFKDQLSLKWDSCQKDGVQCARETLLEMVEKKGQQLSAIHQSFPIKISMAVENYAHLKELFDESYMSCHQTSLQNLNSLEQMILSLKEIEQRCSEEASLKSFPLAFEDHLRKSTFVNYWALAPEFFKTFVAKQSQAFRELIDKAEISSLDQLAQEFPALEAKVFSEGIASLLPHLKEFLFPLSGEGSVYANRAHQLEWEESLKAFLKIPRQESLEKGLKGILSPLSLQSAQVQANQILKQTYKTTSSLVLKQDLLTKVQDSQKRQTVGQALNQEYDECVDQFSSNQRQDDIGSHLSQCDTQRQASLLFEQAKQRFERDVSHSFELTNPKALKILAPIWDLSNCIRLQPLQSLERAVYLSRVSACIDLAKMDVAFNLAKAKIQNIDALLTQEQKTVPINTTKACFTSLLTQVAAKDERLERAIHDEKSYVHLRERSRSVMDIQNERVNNDRSLLSYLNRAQQATQNPFALSDATKMMSLIRDMALNSDSFEPLWLDQEISKCLEAVDDLSLQAIRESFIQNSPYFQSRQTNRVGESDAQVMRSLLDNETIQLVLQMREHQESFSLKTILDPRERLMTREFTIDTLARSAEVISRYIGQGFVFDRDLLKTELVIFRSELNEALRWMNSQEEPVPMKELGDFFKSSELANILATAEISSQVQGRFLGFINQMEINDLADFNRRAGHRPDYRLSQAQKDEKQRLLDKYKNLRELTREMTSSYDFRRIVMQDPRKGEELLEMIKLTSVLPQISGQEVSPAARSQIWRKIGELIIDDKTPGGFAERFVAEIAQNYLDQERESKWRITRWLFYNDGDFKWDSLRSTAAGRKALNYYSRYLLLPKVLDLPMSPYLKNLREQEFKRYLERAQSEQ